GLWLSMVCPISCIPSPINMLVGLLIGIIVVSSLIATTIYFLDNPGYSQIFIDSQKQYDSQYLESAKLAQSEPKDDLQDINSDCQDTDSDLPQFTAILSTTR
ncbi:hypothetical protein N9Y17_03645, partial [Gammaproteobacteria bacterium]|nr:hypothetical protein [Gammaproteobacteria bacterium]